MAPRWWMPFALALGSAADARELSELVNATTSASAAAAQAAEAHDVAARVSRRIGRRRRLYGSNHHTRRSGRRRGRHRKQSGVSDTCVDTANWTNGYDCLTESKGASDGCTKGGWTCKGYELQGWCVDGKPADDVEFALGLPLHDPQANCCACGKPAQAAASDAEAWCDGTKTFQDLSQCTTQAGSNLTEVCQCLRRTFRGGITDGHLPEWAYDYPCWGVLLQRAREEAPEAPQVCAQVHEHVEETEACTDKVQYEAEQFAACVVTQETNLSSVCDCVAAFNMSMAPCRSLRVLQPAVADALAQFHSTPKCKAPENLDMVDGYMLLRVGDESNWLQDDRAIKAVEATVKEVAGVSLSDVAAVIYGYGPDYPDPSGQPAVNERRLQESEDVPWNLAARYTVKAGGVQQQVDDITRKLRDVSDATLLAALAAGAQAAMGNVSRVAAVQRTGLMVNGQAVQAQPQPSGTPPRLVSDPIWALTETPASAADPGYDTTTIVLGVVMGAMVAVAGVSVFLCVMSEKRKRGCQLMDVSDESEDSEEGEDEESLESTTPSRKSDMFRSPSVGKADINGYAGKIAPAPHF
eukprot:TRINITY_DN23338_c0_g1_i1.p1 TRINITY_DN23338_c0_g1~~TRINITY_DN23338_c0_g1_i1.p1  ORF type:complete len:612 (+),score=120.09 TRINITY_DN23338_c0_g1_i1:94-1836(+)